MNEKNEKLENYIKLTEKIDTVVYSNEFFPISQINLLKNLKIKFLTKGLNEESERKILAFYPEDFLEDYINFPIKHFKIVKKSKFINLEHKHYLGNILSLGLKREVLGDLIVKDNVCYGVIIESMFEFLKDNLIKINSTPVLIEEILELEVPKNEFQILNITINSLRLDSIVAEITNLSRNLAVEQLELGNVQLNYEIMREKDKKVLYGDIIIVKKYGKFKIAEENGFTKKNKIKLSVKKYI